MKCVRRLTLQEDNVVAEFIINVGQVPVGVNHRPPPKIGGPPRSSRISRSGVRKARSSELSTRAAVS